MDTGGGQLPSAFRAIIRNLGPDFETVDLSFPTVPPGFDMLPSIPSVTIPPSETGIVGLYLSPSGTLGAPGTDSSFDVMIASRDNPLLNDQTSVDFTAPEIHGVTLSSTPASVSLPPGSDADIEFIVNAVGNVAEDVTLSVVTSDELLDVEFTINVSVADVTQLFSQSVTGSLRTRNEFVSVTSVNVLPPFGDAGTEVAFSTSLLNAVNREQQVSFVYSVLDSSSAEVFTNTENPADVTLTVQASLLQVDLGVFDTTGLGVGQYTVVVTVLDADGVPIPGATGRASLFVGSPVTASLEVTPKLLPPGTSKIINTLQIDATITDGGELLQVLAQLPIDDFRSQLLRDLTFNGDVAYAIANGIHVVDVSNPLAPSVVNFLANGEGSLLNAEVIGERLITMETGNGSPIAAFANTAISSWDLAGTAGSSATNPIRRDRQTNNYLCGSSLAIDDDAAFMSTILVGQNFGNGDITYQNGTVLSFDISDPDDVVPLDVLFNANDRNGALPLFRNGGNNNVFDVLVPTSGTLFVASSTATDTDTQTGGGRFSWSTSVIRPASTVTRRIPARS